MRSAKVNGQLVEIIGPDPDSERSEVFVRYSGTGHEARVPIQWLKEVRVHEDGDRG